MKIDSILVATDFSDCSAAALASAEAIAPAFGASLRVLHVLEPVRPYEYSFYDLSLGLEFVKEDLGDARRKVMQWIEKTRRSKSLEITSVAREGGVSTEIEKEAAECGAPLIVVGTHGHGPVTRAILGSVAERTVRHAGRSVLTTHEALTAPIRKILVPVDVAHPDGDGIVLAESLRKTFDAKLDFLFVFRDPQRFPIVTWKHFPSVEPSEFYEHAKKRAKENLEKAVAQRVPIDDSHTFHVAMGSAHREIARHAEESNADLIVLETHGRTGVKHALLGSVAEKVLRSAPCPVWTRNPGH